MQPYKLGEMEQRLADLIWETEPLAPRTLVSLCQKSFSWKRTTTYTMLKRLCERGIFQNENGVIRSLMSKEQFHTAQGQQFLDEAFSGSLPQFVAAFIKNKRLKQKEINEIATFIQQYKEE